MSKDKVFGITKQVAWAEMQLLRMEEDFNFSLEQFGQEYATRLFATKKQTYERITCIKESLERLEALQANLGTISPDLFTALSGKPLPQEGVLDAIVCSFNGKSPKKIKNL